MTELLRLALWKTATLAVPYALDGQQRLVRPTEGELGGQYCCLQCGHKVHFKPGKVRKAHFYHASGATCSGESVLHLAAKRALVEGLPGLTEIGVLLVCRCAGCEDVESKVVPLPTFDSVEAEVALGAYRLDVALLWEGKVVMAIEVYQTHRIGDAKGRELPVPWVEVPAENVLESVEVLQPVIEASITKGQLSLAQSSSRTLKYRNLIAFDQYTHWQDLRFYSRRTQQTLLISV